MKYTDITRQQITHPSRREYMRVYMKKRRASDPEFRAKSNQSAHKRYRSTGLFEQRLKEQGNKCAIPGCMNSLLGANGHLDHCHVTGTVRGVLCRQHNVGLGLFADNADHLRAAADYLDHWANARDQHAGIRR